ERDCSLQRRHQKVIEEAPAPGMDEATREQLCAAAVKAAKAVDYVGAGTIEFIADASEGLRADRIWFMEMNTRLQVEHPVTEEITGVDLVEWQLRVASGEALPLEQDEIAIDGHAIEARLYAEDAATGFLPSTGSLRELHLPDFGVRIDAGVSEGTEISPYYDPMIAKLIVKSWSRDEAIERLADACSRVRVWPVKTNAWFLKRLLENEQFRWGMVSTGLIEASLAQLTAAPQPSHEARQHALQAHLFFAGPHRAGPLDRTAPLGFRLNRTASSSTMLNFGGIAERIELDLAIQTSIIDFDTVDEEVIIFEGGAPFVAALHHPRGTGSGVVADGAILSPMPGRIIAVDVAAGDAVTKGQKLVTLEAMKMEHSLVAPFDGTVAALDAVAGGQVSEGAVLARIEGIEN
ncbi:MAG: methylcrotonoyl-CoA carboxylase, partial [Rubrivivax sp.]|nr:methylcrotonoyl-CoA carboxylase [Pyrinomonadaceae bacterium]